MNTARPCCLPLAGLLLALGGCGPPDPMEGTLESNVAQAFAPCSENEIKFLARKHNFQLAFKACANNNFTAYRWSPDGTQLYFQLVLSPYVMDAEAAGRPIGAVPTTTPIGPGAWVGRYRLVIPVGPDETGTRNRLAIYDREGQTIFHVDTDLTAVRETQPSGDPTEVLILGTRGETEGIWRISTATGTAEPAFSWLDRAPSSFTYQPKGDVVVLGWPDQTVSMHRGADGSALGRWPQALRGSLHPDGRYLMLEHLGEPVSIFYQRAWDELSPEARERELRRLKQFEERLPEGTPTRVQPPTLSWVDLQSGQRWMMQSAYGDHFQWYEALGHYGSFFLWGFEGKQVKRNVALGGFDGRFRSLDKGRKVLGVERFEAGEDPAYRPPEGAPPAEAERTGSPGGPEDHAEGTHPG